MYIYIFNVYYSSNSNTPRLDNNAVDRGKRDMTEVAPTPHVQQQLDDAEYSVVDTPVEYATSKTPRNLGVSSASDEYSVVDTPAEYSTSKETNKVGPSSKAQSPYEHYSLASAADEYAEVKKPKRPSEDETELVMLDNANYESQVHDVWNPAAVYGNVGVSPLELV